MTYLSKLFNANTTRTSPPLSQDRSSPSEHHRVSVSFTATSVSAVRHPLSFSDTGAVSPLERFQQRSYFLVSSSDCWCWYKAWQRRNLSLAAVNQVAKFFLSRASPARNCSWMPGAPCASKSACAGNCPKIMCGAQPSILLTAAWLAPITQDIPRSLQ